MSRIFNDVNRFVIDWTLNSLCTYHCSYCPDGLHRGVNQIVSKEEDPALIENFLNSLANQISGRSVHIFINGGEPTISPSLETIINFCNSKGWCAYVNTNGSRSLEWWKENAHKIYKVTVSYHPESVDESIFEKVEYISTQTNVGVFTLMYPPLWDKSASAYNRFLAMSDVTIAPSRVFRRDSHDIDVSYDYTDEQLQWLNSNSKTLFRGNNKMPPDNNFWGTTFLEHDKTISKLDEVEFVNNRKNSFTNWKCNMGIDHIYIDQFGNIKQSACKQSKTFSNIQTFSSLMTESTLCKMQWCMCTADVMIPKGE